MVILPALVPALGVLSLLSAPVSAQSQPRLLVDIHPVPGQSSFPQHLFEVGGKVFFYARDAVHGREPWITDGTPAGTRMLADIHKGAGDSWVSEFGRAGDTVLFGADDGSNVWRLYGSDGTPAGTRLLAPATTAGARAPANFYSYRGICLFQAEGGTGGLWRSDGTPQGTYSLNTGVNSFYAAQEFDGLVYFAGGDQQRGEELWVTDGTSAGTRLVIDLHAITTVLGPKSSRPRDLTVFDGALFFSADDGKSGGGRHLFRSDGTAAGTRRITPFLYAGPLKGARELTVSGDQLFFFMLDHLVATDGTAAGVRVLGPVLRDPSFLTAFRGIVVFANSDWNGTELWGSDGTSQYTRMLYDIMPGLGSGDPREFMVVGDRYLFFSAMDSHPNRELWRLDRDSFRLDRVAEINPKGSAQPRYLVMRRGQLLFGATDGTHGWELMTLDPGASSLPQGAGCAAAAEIPELRSTDPILGQALELRCGPGTPLRLGMMVFGLPAARSQRLGGGCVLHFDVLQPFVMQGFLLLNDGRGRVVVPIPNNPGLLGVTLAAQAAVPSAGTAPLGLALSNGLLIRVGR